MKSCKKLFVPEKVCYISFAEQPVSSLSSLEIVGYTLRGEQIIFDYDADGSVIGIELVAPNLKPCQVSK